MGCSQLAGVTSHLQLAELSGNQFHEKFVSGTLQAICACHQICSWSTGYPEIPSNC